MIAYHKNEKDILHLVRSRAFVAAATLFVAGELLQLVFIICLNAGLTELDSSLRFAGIGVPIWSLAIIVASISEAKVLRKAAVIGGSVFGIGVWLFLITVH